MRLDVRASCGVILSEMVQTEDRNPDETGGGMTISDSSKQALSLGTVTRVSKDGIKIMLKVYNHLAQKSNYHTLVQVGGQLVF